MNNAYPGAQAGPLYSCWLSSGGILSVRSDRVEVGPDSYPVADLTSARLVANPAISPTPGMFTGAAVYLGLRSGKTLTLVPTNHSDSWRVLETLYTLRPELRTTLPPVPDLGARIGGSMQGFFSDPGSEKIIGGIAHLSIFFLPFILPLVLWLALKDSMPYASHQSKQAFWFHVLVSVGSLVFFAIVAVLFLVVALVTGALGIAGAASASSGGSPLPLLPVAGVGGIFGIVFIILFWLGALALSISSIVLAIMAAIRAFEGKPFHYPFLGRI
jgi:uncharacterized Tic20 family protein